MRSDRLLSLLLMLQARGRVTAPEAARELEVSIRTVYRDVEALGAAGVPVWTSQGRGGGIELMPGYRTDVTGLTAAEARALVAMTGRAVPDDLGLGTALASAVHKLVAAVPASHREAARSARERVLVDHSVWYRTRDAPPGDTAGGGDAGGGDAGGGDAGGGGGPHLVTVQDAVWADRRLRVRYRHGDGRAAGYLLDPWGLVLKAGVWYLVAAHRGRPRLWRTDRMLSVTPLPEAAHRPDGLDLEQEWIRLRTQVERPRTTVTVRLRVRDDARDLVLRVTAGQRTPTPPRAVPDDDTTVPASSPGASGRPGWCTYDLEFRAPGAARGILLGFGEAVEVVSPAALREDLTRTARAVVALYGG